MAQEDDVERLFSWLQTPDIRYREFAGGREVSDTIVAFQEEVSRPVLNPPAPGHVQLDEEYPQDQFPDQSQVVVKVEPEAGVPTAPSPQRPLAQGEAVAPAETVARGPSMIAPTLTPSTRPDPGPPPPQATSEGAGGRALDSVFNRLAGGRSGSRDSRDQTTRNPGSGPTTDDRLC
jgi:hypothetical protein